MDAVELLSTSPGWLLGSVFVFSLLVGSFLNVVIHRIPMMMQQDWLKQANEILDRPPQADAPISLSRPRSRCPHCHAAIHAWQNIPVISYLFLRGRCAHCDNHISPRYPLIELLTAILSTVVAAELGFGWPLLAGLTFTYFLVALTFIDVDHQLLPDSLTLLLLWLGLFVNLFGTFTDLQSAVIGAIAGYLVLWLVYQSFRLLTGKEGMGFGDFKLLAALGAWLGWQLLPIIVLLSSLVGAVVGIALIVCKRHQRSQPIPFGPYLAAAGWLAFVWGDQLNQAYLRLSGLA